MSLLWSSCNRNVSFWSTGVLLLVTLLFAAQCRAAAIDNAVVGEARISTSDDLISTIVEKCFHSNAMHCLKEKVLNYLDNVAGVGGESPSGRAYDDNVLDKVIVDRVGRILNTNEFRVQLPETLFASSVLSYRVDRGFDLEIPQNEGNKVKEKLSSP